MLTTYSTFLFGFGLCVSSAPASSHNGTQEFFHSVGHMSPLKTCGCNAKKPKAITEFQEFINTFLVYRLGIKQLAGYNFLIFFHINCNGKIDIIGWIILPNVKCQVKAFYAKITCRKAAIVSGWL